MADPYTILFVCTGNICRSPMAEAMLRNIMPADQKPKVRVASAGTHATDGLPAEPHAVRVMSEFSIDLSGHLSRMIRPEILSGADLVLVMEALHDRELRNFGFAEISDIRLMGSFGVPAELGEIPDPYGRDLAYYRRTASQILSCLDGVIEHLRKELLERR